MDSCLHNLLKSYSLLRILCFILDSSVYTCFYEMAYHFTP